MRTIIIAFYIVLFLSNFTYAAHILEPLGTESASTPQRGRMFGEIVYQYEKSGGKTHFLPLAFEIGLGERTQLNLEGEILLRAEKADGQHGQHEKGIEEMSLGVKHRFLDETARRPDAAFEVEFSPAIGLKGNGQGVKGILILSKNLNPRFVLHINGAYELETEREIELHDGTDEVVNQETWFYNVAPMFKIIPDRLMFVVEFNSQKQSSGNTEMRIAPEIIGVFQTETFFALQNFAVKLAFPIGLNDHSPDKGVILGFSKLF